MFLFALLCLLPISKVQAAPDFGALISAQQAAPDSKAATEAVENAVCAGLPPKIDPRWLPNLPVDVSALPYGLGTLVVPKAYLPTSATEPQHGAKFAKVSYLYLPGTEDTVRLFCAVHSFGRPGRFPDEHGAFVAQCHAAGQARPTPLLLRYGPGDYNCLHQDLYGALAFPLQAAFLLSRAGDDFTGGAFALTEQRPRMQSRVEVVPLHQGEGVVFAVNQRPAQGSRGVYRVTMRHGVSRLLSGSRYTLGIIFHDAQ